MYEISANIDGGWDDLDVVCSFDPTKVIARLRVQFPDAEVDPTDYGWRDYQSFLRMGLSEEQSSALGVAAADARRRGPIWKFRVPSPAGGWVLGHAERHHVSFVADGPFPEPLRSQLLRFMEGLRFAPCVSVECRLTGDA